MSLLDGTGKKILILDGSKILILDGSSLSEAHILPVSHAEASV